MVEKPHRSTHCALGCDNCNVIRMLQQFLERSTKRLFTIIIVKTITVDAADTWRTVSSFEAPPVAELYPYWQRKWLIFFLAHRVIHRNVSYISEHKNWIVGVGRSRDNELGGGVGRGTHSQGSKPARAFSIIGFAINVSRSVRTVWAAMKEKWNKKEKNKELHTNKSKISYAIRRWKRNDNANLDSLSSISSTSAGSCNRKPSTELLHNNETQYRVTVALQSLVSRDNS